MSASAWMYVAPHKRGVEGGAIRGFPKFREPFGADFFAAAQPLDEGGEFGRGLCAEFCVEGVFEILAVLEASSLFVVVQNPEIAA